MSNIHSLGGNISKINQLQRDSNGNILQCPYPDCGSTLLIKAGTDGSENAKKRYKCKECGRKSTKPKVVKTFKKTSKREPEWTPEELVEHRMRTFKKKERYENSAEFLDIKIDDTKPIGLFVMGDPHVDDPGCDMPEIVRHLNIVNKTKGMYAGNMGDMQNNWMQRTKLAEQWAHQDTSGEQAWMLTEWLIKYTNWVFLVAGNHDMWSGIGDPLKWICRPLNIDYNPHGVRLRLKLPKHNIRINEQHQFRGHSIYNTAHSIVKAAIFDTRDHLLLAGHRHISGYMPIKDSDSKIVMHCLQVGSYKKYDSYAKMLNLPNKMMSPCAVVVFNTRLDDKHPDFIKVFWEVEEGADYLTYLRGKK